MLDTHREEFRHPEMLPHEMYVKNVTWDPRVGELSDDDPLLEKARFVSPAYDKHGKPIPAISGKPVFAAFVPDPTLVKPKIDKTRVIMLMHIGLMGMLNGAHIPHSQIMDGNCGMGHASEKKLFDLFSLGYLDRLSENGEFSYRLTEAGIEAVQQYGEFSGAGRKYRKL